MNHFLLNGFADNPKVLGEEPFLSLIANQCSDIRITIHNNFKLNIIDMFSFNEEYEKFFNENLTENSSLKNRITKLKAENKKIKNRIDWDELKAIRNTILAHNLRNKKENNQFAIKNLIVLHRLVFDFDRCIEYCEIIQTLFLRIKEEFESEYKIAKISFDKLVKANS